MVNKLDPASLFISAASGCRLSLRLLQHSVVFTTASKWLAIMIRYTIPCDVKMSLLLLRMQNERKKNLEPQLTSVPSPLILTSCCGPMALPLTCSYIDLMIVMQHVFIHACTYH